MVKHRGWEHVEGGRDIKGKEKKEDYIPGPGYAFPDPKTGKHGDKRPGHVRPDLTMKDRHGHTIYIQHVDVDKNGKPDDREVDSAIRLHRATRSDVYMIPKQWQLRRLRKRKNR